MLLTAFLDARAHKRSRRSVLDFEARLEENLADIAQALESRTYRPWPSSCFIVRDPKQREIFAADFRDRVVHHLYYSLSHRLFERTFIADAYSCIRGRGTHYGQRRLAGHIRQVSDNYSRPAYILKLDIRGYFMHIDRRRLVDIATTTLRRMAPRRVEAGCGATWADTVDIGLLDYLTRAIALADPTEGCRRLGPPSDWRGLPPSKSLFCSPPGCGLPIGNLTSQLFSNVYLNPFDQFMKREMQCRHYGRYVDDAYVVCSDRRRLRALVPKARLWLRDNLGLELNEGKVRIADARQGVEFLGAYLKPWRAYVASGTLRRIAHKLGDLDSAAAQGLVAPDRLRDSLSSFGGVLGHYASFRLRRDLFMSLLAVRSMGHFDKDFRKLIINN